VARRVAWRPWRRPRGFGISGAFVPVPEVVVEDVAGVHAHEATVLADEHGDSDRRRLVFMHGQRKVEVKPSHLGSKA
jgi:hypothetical protein